MHFFTIPVLSPANMAEGDFKVVPVIALPSSVFLCSLILQEKTESTINNGEYRYLILSYVPESDLRGGVL